MTICGMCICALASALPAAPREWTPEVFDYDRPAYLEVLERGVPKDRLPDTRQQELFFKNLRTRTCPCW